MTALDEVTSSIKGLDELICGGHGLPSEAMGHLEGKISSYLSLS